MRSTVQKINTSIDLSKNSKVKGIFVLRVNSSYFNFSASYTMVFLKSLVCLSPWLLGHFRSETIAFSTGYSVVCCVCALALLTPLIRSAVHRFATLACLLASLTRSVHGLAHSLCSLPHGTVEILEYVFIQWKCVWRERTRFLSSLETRPDSSGNSFSKRLGVATHAQRWMVQCCSTKRCNHLQRWRHSFENDGWSGQGKSVELPYFLYLTQKTLIGKKSGSQSSTFLHIREKQGFHFLIGKLRLSTDRMSPPMKLIG